MYGMFVILVFVVSTMGVFVWSQLADFSMNGTYLGGVSPPVASWIKDHTPSIHMSGTAQSMLTDERNEKVDKDQDQVPRQLDESKTMHNVSRESSKTDAPSIAKRSAENTSNLPSSSGEHQISINPLSFQILVDSEHSIPMVLKKEPARRMISADNLRRLILQQKLHNGEELEQGSEKAQTIERAIGDISKSEKFREQLEKLRRFQLRAKAQPSQLMQQAFILDPPYDDMPDSEEYILQVGNRTIVGMAHQGGVYDGLKLRLFPQARKFPETVKPKFAFYFGEDGNEKWVKYLWAFTGALRDEGWNETSIEKGGFENIHLFFTRDNVPRHVQQGRQMVSSMGVCNCLGGTKSQQLECRRKYTAKFGCTYEDLKIQPIQFYMSKEEDCRQAFEHIDKMDPTNPKLIMAKPTNSLHGDGLEFFSVPEQNKDIKERFSNCDSQTILMEYISNPATMHGGYKFDLRTYMFVASTRPHLVFVYKWGVIRKADTKYDVDSREANVHVMNARNQSLKEHFYNYTHMKNKVFGPELNFSSDYLETYLQPEIKRVHRLMFQSEIDAFKEKDQKYHRGRFHIFAMDWVIDDTGKLHLLEGNKFPALINYPKGTGVTPKIWHDTARLLLLIQVAPRLFDTQGVKSPLVRKKFNFQGWELIFNSLEEEFEQKHYGKYYNPCEDFREEVIPNKGRITGSRRMIPDKQLAMADADADVV